MVGSYGTYEEKKNAYRTSVGKAKRNKLLERPRRIWTYIKMDRKKKREAVDWIILTQDTDSCKHATRTLDCIQ